MGYIFFLDASLRHLRPEGCLNGFLMHMHVLRCRFIECLTPNTFPHPRLQLNGLRPQCEFLWSVNGVILGQTFHRLKAGAQYSRSWLAFVVKSWLQFLKSHLYIAGFFLRFWVNLSNVSEPTTGVKLDGEPMDSLGE